MRDVVYRNITSQDKGRRVMASSEVCQGNGLRTTVVRHFICVIRKAQDRAVGEVFKPRIYIYRYYDTGKQRERFFCRIRDRFCLMLGSQIYQAEFLESVRINVEAQKP